MPLDEIYSLEHGMQRFKDLLEGYDKLYDSKRLSDGDAERLSRDIRQIVQIVENRHQYWESRRGLFLEIGLGMVGLSIAIITALAAVFDRLMSYSPTFIVLGVSLLLSLNFIVGGIAIIRVWNRQNNPDYPFTKVFKHWRWQYRYAEEKAPPFKYRFNKIEEFEKEIKTYIENLYSYAERTLSLRPMEVLQQDISQLFLLIENEKYKIKFVSELRDTVTRWLYVGLGVGIVSLVICALLVVFGQYECIQAYFAD